jgi:hypothetical protein
MNHPFVAYKHQTTTIPPYHTTRPKETKPVYTPFPPDSIGWFHLYRPSDVPLLASQIRFRIRDLSKPDFAAGRDLLRPDGSPWCLYLVSVLNSRKTSLLPFFSACLQQDGLVTLKELKVFTSQQFDLRRDSRVIWTPREPFEMDFTMKSIRFTLLGAKEGRTFILQNVFRDQREYRQGRPFYPYTGQSYSVKGCVISWCDRTGSLSV